jgi:hypothetical protein
MAWKKAKALTRLTIKTVSDNEELIHYEDILESEFDDLPALMVDLHCYFDWLWWDETTDWEIIKVEDVEIFGWNEFRSSGRIRGFYERFGFGECLSVCYEGDKKTK